MDAVVFQTTIVRPTLQALQLWTAEAEMLLMGTAAQESQLTYIRQLGGGPALGYFQMEPATHDDCWTNFLNYRADLTAKVLAVRTASGQPQAIEMETNLKYAAAMARVRYLRVPALIPVLPRDLAAYWKQHYNTPLGAGTMDDFIANWNRILAPNPYATIA
jgi:hypothetical protein